MKRVLAAAVLMLAVAPGSPLGAQQNRDASAEAEGRRLVTEALKLAERGDTAHAVDRAKRAARVAPGLADAHFLYGLLLARTAGAGFGSWPRRISASRELDAALEIDRDNPRYLIEVARLRLKQPILRVQAERLFRRARDAARTRGDPAVEAEVEAEIGDIYFRRYDAVAHRRTVLGPVQTFDWESAMRDPHYTKDLLLSNSVEVPGMGEDDLGKAEQHYRDGVRAWPASEPANAGLLALLAETGRDEEFLDAAQVFARAADTSSRAQLYLGLGLWRARRGRAADGAFARALARMPEAERRPLTDLSFVLRAAEAVSYRQLPDSQRTEYEGLYWWATEPLRLTQENEYRVEHLARVAFADLRFSAPDLRLRGWQTDRGQICIRYGPPPVIATFAPDVQENSDDLRQTGMMTTVWYYPERNLRFVFFGPPTYNYQRLVGDFSSYFENLRFVQPVTYDNVPVTRTIDSIPIQAVQLRVAAGGDTARTELMFFAGIPVRDMVHGIDLRKSEMESGLFISDTRMRDVVTRRATEAVSFGAEEQFETRTYAARIAPGDYLYRFEARLPTIDRAARGAAQLTVEDLNRQALTLSDVVVADRVQPKEEGAAQRGLQDFFLDPNAAMRFRRTDPVHLYAEVYHLTPKPSAGADGAVAEFQVSVRLTVQSLDRSGMAARVIGGMLDAIGASAQGNDQLTLSYVAQEPLAGRDRVPVYLAIDLAGAPAGTYRLDFAVTDLTNGQIATRSRTLEITGQAR